MTQNHPACHIDVALCIDGTGSMHSLIDNIRQIAQSVRELFTEGMARRNRRVSRFRIRVIVFRDYQYDGDDAMVESDFFDLDDPDQQLAFEHFVDGIEAMGGGDGPENALEALVMALRSKWTSEGGRYRRHAIMLFTDAPALPLRDPGRMEAPGYPQDMPASLNELQDLFEQGDPVHAPDYVPRHGRLIVFAPASDGDTWSALKTWKRTWVAPTRPGGGCSEVELKDALFPGYGVY